MHHKRINTKRCSICDRTNNLLVQNLPGQYVKQRQGYIDYFPDPKNKAHLICVTCYEIVEEQRQQFLIQDLEKELEKESELEMELEMGMEYES